MATVPLFERRGPDGAVRHKAAGVQAALRPGDSADADAATWLVSLSTLGGVSPRPGDRLRGTDGVWWVVRAVGPAADGRAPCACDREQQPE